jgi:hypothetical protein
MKLRIALDTMTDVENFVKAVSQVDAPVYLNDGVHQQVCATSLLGAILAKMEWSEIYCQCELDVSSKILPWII